MTTPAAPATLHAIPRSSTSRVAGVGLASLGFVAACVTPAPAPTAPPAESVRVDERAAAGSERALATSDGAAVAEPSARDAAPESTPRWLSGSSSTKLVARSSDDGSDIDLRESFVLDAGDVRRDAFTAHVHGLITADLDGAGSRDDQVSFPSLADTFSGSVDAWFYQAYVDVERVESLETLRVGRQIDYETPEFAFFDGVSLASEELGAKRARFGAYGGVPVHLYESSRSGDVLFGAFGECVPWKRGRARIDWMHLEDETRLAEHDDDLLALSLWQRATDKLRFDGRYTTLEGAGRDVKLGANWNDPKHDFTARATWRRLLETQQDLVLELDPFYGALQSLFPYDQLGLSLEKGFGERATLRGGFDVRRVDDDADIGTFNRDYDRAFVGATLHDVFTKGLELDVDADFWDADGRSVDGFGVSLARDFGNGFEAALGTYYSLYKYDWLSSNEREDVRTWYLKLERAWSKALKGELAYDFDDDENDTYHTLRVGLTWRF